MTVPFADAFRGRSVLLTGHTGFKGSWLALWLHRLGAHVSGHALAPPTEHNNFEAAGVEALLASHRIADVRDREALSVSIAAAAPQVVLHLAAQPLVRHSYAAPYDTFEVNVMGTVAVLEAVRALARPCVVIVVSSDKCYENREQVWSYRESDSLGGSDPYSASKGAAELVVASYRKSFFPISHLSEHGVRLASVRAGNVIGGGDWARDRIIADTVRALSARKPVPVRNPAAIRPWQHVLEPLSGYLALAARLLAGEDALSGSWNFGPRLGDEATVREVVELFCQVWGGGGWQDHSDPGQLPEASVLRLSIDQAVAQLGWRPRWALSEAIGRTARWYRAFYDGADQKGAMRERCLQDIADYEASG